MHNMHLRFRDSLLMSLGIVMMAIALLAFASMAASIFIADTTQGLATAINESGALRMRSYRIASKLTHNATHDKKHWQETYQLIIEFEQHLHSFNLTNVIPVSANTPVNLAYLNIQRRWENEIKPLFDVYLDGIISTSPDTSDTIDMSISEDAVNNLRNHYLLIVPDFVSNIDKLVSLLEEVAENKIKGLRTLQYTALALTIILMLIALFLIYRRIHQPLKQLLSGAEHASQRDFLFRINYTGKDELGRLGSAFNSMAEDLSEIYNELEERIKQKTSDLKQSNHSLELLYRTVNRLYEADSPHVTFSQILDDIRLIVKDGRGAICLNGNKEEQASMLASTLSGDLNSHICSELNCKKCLNNSQSNINTINNKDNQQIITLPISDQVQQYGVLVIEPDTDMKIEPWQMQLLETIASHIGIAIKLSKQTAESRRLVLIEERGAIARELHDSLAQSLTYMKIQLSRLQALIPQSSTNTEASHIISDLRLGLNSAYRELRELLTTFRLKIDGKDFNETMVKTILEFNDRSDTEITFDNQITYFDLTPNEEIHVLQLIREALSNIVQHAQASSANVSIKYNNSGNIEILISDNGTGIIESKSKLHHYGLNIMKERSKVLDGDFEITKNEDNGTSVLLSFTPTNKTAPYQLKS